MHKNCLKQIAETTFVCVVTGGILYAIYVGEHQEHLPHQLFPTSPVQPIIAVGTTSVPSTASIANFNLGSQTQT